MNTTSWLTVLGLVGGACEFAKSQGIYPQYTGAVFAATFLISGALSEGVKKK